MSAFEFSGKKCFPLALIRDGVEYRRVGGILVMAT